MIKGPSTWGLVPLLPLLNCTILDTCLTVSGSFLFLPRLSNEGLEPGGLHCLGPL